MESLLKDLRYSIRMLGKNPGFAWIAVLTLALGVGANTAIFTVIDAVLLRPLRFAEPERLVSVQTTDERNPQSRLPSSWLDVADWRARSQSFEGFGTWFTIDLTLTGGGEPMRVKGKGVEGDLFGLLGVPPMLGRVFRAEDHYAVVLSYGLWQRRFNSDPNVVGRAVTLNGESYTVVGVMPREFQFPIEAEAGELWVTWDYSQLPGPKYKRDTRLSEVIGRLRAGVPLARAQAEMEGIAAALREQYPDTNKDIGVRVIPAAEDLVGDHRRALLVLFGAVGCVLLIACVNVANLLLARAAGRRREMAVRAALGASRARILRQLLTESLLLSLAGGMLGSLVAMWGVEALIALNPGYLPGADRIGIDGRVLGFTLFVSLLVGLIFGLAPAWYASKIDLTTALKDGERTASAGAGSRRLGGALVVAEIAIALVLLAGAALLTGSFWRLQRVDPGLDPRGVLTFRLSLPYRKYDTAQAGEFFRQLQPRLQTIPGVRAASVVFPLPLNGDEVFDSMDVSLDTRLAIEGRMLPRSERPRTDGRTVQPDYFRAMGIGLAAGRDFTERDDAKAEPVAIINETLARLHFPGEDPFGKRLRLDSVYIQGEPPMRRVVGVVGDVKHRGLSAETRPEVYVPLAQDPFQEMFVVVKTEGDPMGVVGAVREVVLGLDEGQPIYDIKTLSERLGYTLAGQRFNTLLLAIFSGLAVALAVIGLYGVLSYAVAQRTHEIGIRLALGAEAGDVVRLIVRQGMKLVLIGIAIGLAGALTLTRLMESMLFGATATDALSFVLVSMLLAVVTMLACYIPARRATKVDPIAALRDQ
jgi:putative ABC transport system permease protein